ncbi:MAG TPA: D-glycerate dehydrogenase [Polyangia bacterium]
MAERAKVVMTAMLPGAARRVLEAEHEVVAPAAGTMSHADLAAAVGDADGLVCLLRDPVDAALLARAPRLKVVANYAVGFNNVDLAAATARGVVVTNTPDVLTDATADLTFALLLAAARRVPEGDAMVRAGAFHGWEPELLLGADVYGRTLGIAGLGRIGRAVARRARGFDMRVLYSDPAPAPAEVERELGATRVGKDELLGSCDFLTLHCPLTPATHHYLGAAELARMSAGAYLVNTARGPLVDEEALAAALAAGRLAGAALDVFEREPAVHPGLLASPRVVLAPHAGSATVAARRRMAELCVGSVMDVLAGRRPRHVVNPEVYR